MIAAAYPPIKKTLKAFAVVNYGDEDDDVFADITIEVRRWISTYGRFIDRRDTPGDRYEHNLLADAFKKGWEHMKATFTQRRDVYLYVRDNRLGRADALDSIFTGALHWSLFARENNPKAPRDLADMLEVTKECIDAFVAGMGEHASPYVTFGSANEDDNQRGTKIFYGRAIPMTVSPMSNLTLTFLERMATDEDALATCYKAPTTRVPGGLVSSPT